MSDGRGYRRYWDEERETRDPRERERLILERIRHQLAYVYAELPFYRRLYDERGFHPDQVRTLEDFSTRVPVVTKAMLVADQAAHPPFGSYAGPATDMARIHGSSGTSGTPTMYCVSQADWTRSRDLVALAMWAMGARPDDIAQIGFPFSLFFGGWGVLQGLEHIGVTAFPVGNLDSERHLELIGRVGSTIFSGTPSYCQHLISVAERMGVDLAASSVRRLIVGGEPGGSLAGTRELITEGWGASVHDSGSTSEMYPFNTNVTADPADGVLLIDDEVFSEVVDRDDPNVPLPDGERGGIVYTHLWRESQPMIRFWSGDETYKVADGPTSCGRTYPRLPEGILGRLDDMLVIRGANVYPSAVESVLRRVDGLGAEFEILVDRSGAMDEMTVRVEVRPGLAA
ncbi:MAG: phenylacetate--CoA ligase family protein, partial [Solirubrobacterales bacterium]|nr:phenylacetate--CoA ligase family protein [Solirubrobacterales bacterium]